MLAFVEFIVARIQRDTGYLRRSRSTVGRLRSELGAAARKLIETGSGAEYRLAISKAHIGERISVTACFFELVGLGLISEINAEILRKTCPLCERPEGVD